MAESNQPEDSAASDVQSEAQSPEETTPNVEEAADEELNAEELDDVSGAGVMYTGGSGGGTSTTPPPPPRIPPPSPTWP